MIRRATEADLEAMLAIYGPYVESTTISFEYTPPTPEEFAGRFREITAQFPWLVWEEAGQVQGYAYASAPFTREAYRWCAEPTVYLRPQARGKGIARELYRQLEEILKIQGYRIFYALVCGENQASLRFHEKMGYCRRAVLPRCGWKFDRWLDMIWMEKQVNLVDNPGGFPIPWGQIVKYDEM